MGSEQVPVPAKFVMFLGVRKQAHENQSRYDTSGDDFLRHGCPPIIGSRLDTPFASPPGTSSSLPHHQRTWPMPL
jgi:hypothetical protein